MLGGLIEDSLNDTVEKVPGLGDIPVLGYLFKYQTKKRGKTNLMVFLRPTVVRSNLQSVAVAGDRYDYIRGAQLDNKVDSNLFLPKIDSPLLPRMENGKPVGGALLRREPQEGTPLPEVPMALPPPSTSPAPPPATIFPVEPPIINLR